MDSTLKLSNGHEMKVLFDPDVVRLYDRTHNLSVECPVVDVPALLNAIALAAKTSLRAIVEDEDAKEDLVMQRSGVEVYVTWDDGDPEDVAECWYATSYGTSSNAEQAFDVRELPIIPEELEAKYEAEFPDDDYKQDLAYAIDIGYLTPDGLREDATTDEEE